MAQITEKGKKLRKEHPDKYKILVEAMNATNGKVDNELTVALLKSSAVTVEDVVRLGCTYVQPPTDENSIWAKERGLHEFWHKVGTYGNKESRKERRKNLREEHSNECRTFKFKDTFLHRAMVQMGLTPTENDGEWYEHRRSYTTDTRKRSSFSYYGGEKLADTKYAEVTVMYMRAGADLRRAIMSSESLSRLWTEQARVRREVDRIYNTTEAEKNPITSTNEEWRKFQSDHIIKEFGWLANMPENIAKDLEGFMAEDKQRRYNMETLPPTLTNTILDAFRYPSTDKNVELVREAYQVMEYIGIGVCWNYVEKVKDDGTKEYKDVYSNQKSTGVGAMLKKTSSMMRRFTADLRKGFEPDDVRELIVEDLNNWATAKVGGRWQFYARVDAPKEYEGFGKKKKPSMQKVELFNKSKSLELDENNPEDAGFFAVLDKLDNKE